MDKPMNFMTKDIVRFIDDQRPEIKTTFQDLFGSDEIQSAWGGLQGREREEAIVEAYWRRLKPVYLWLENKKNLLK
jgi:hypothetical protein